MKNALDIKNLTKLNLGTSDDSPEKTEDETSENSTEQSTLSPEEALEKQREELAQIQAIEKEEAKKRAKAQKKEAEEKQKKADELLAQQGENSGKTMTMLKDHVLQRGMPCRPELIVTTNLKQGQKITDPAIMKLLIDDEAPIGYV